jgi:hypothetical protein
MINEFASLECIYLLWLATDGSVPLPLLLAPNFDSLFNLPKPGWSRVTLGNLLVKMRAARLIRFHLNALSSLDESFDIFEAIHEVDFEDRLISPSYSLTAQGGELWEKIFKPRWSEALRHSFTYAESSNECLFRLESINLKHINSVFGWKSKERKNLCDSKVVISRATPWYPFYWKQLPCGYIVDSIPEALLPKQFFQQIPMWHTNIESLLTSSRPKD